MKYSLTANIINTAGASKVLTSEELVELTDGIVDSGGAGLLPGETLTVTCDLFNRYSLDTIKYYHDGGDVVVYLSEIEGVWEAASTSSESWGTAASTGTMSPRWIKVQHSYSGAGSVGYEIAIFNNDTNLLFGGSGLFSSYGFDASGITIQPVQVYNNSLTTRNINVFIDDSVNTDADEFILVGIDTGGPFYQKYERGINFPGTIDWDLGQHNNTITTVSGHLTLSGSETVGTYYSPVLDIGPYENSRIFWERDVGAGDVLWGGNNSEPCFGLRSFNIPPSGIWYSGQFPSDLDIYWSVLSGQLNFNPVPNNTIMGLRGHNYVQLAVTLSGSDSPFIYKAGIETALTVSGVAPKSYKEVFLTSVSGTTSGKQTSLICWYKE